MATTNVRATLFYSQLNVSIIETGGGAGSFFAWARCAHIPTPMRLRSFFVKDDLLERRGAALGFSFFFSGNGVSLGFLAPSAPGACLLAAA